MRPVMLVLTAVILGGCSTAPLSFTPEQPLAPAEFSHALWQESVSAHVQEGLVDYPALQREQVLPQYLALLDRVDPNQLSTNERLAFWINAYNAFAVQGILDHYSPRTLLGRYQFFIAREYRVGGETVNLYNLEREILISQFHEPRMHFAIVCASASCPKLQPWAYEGQRLDRQLQRVTSEFVNDASRNRFDRSKKIAFLSMIFKWFAKDFEARSGSVLNFVREYVQDMSLKQDLLEADYTVEFLAYDWWLNGPPPIPEGG